MKQYLENKILFIGPEYSNHRGGIGAVIGSYKQFFKKFLFLPSHREMNKALLPFYSIKQIILFPFYLVLHPGVKIIHIHGASNGSFYRKYLLFLIAKYLFGKKIIYHIHGGGFNVFYHKSNNFIKKLISHFLSNADKVICLSDSWYSFYQQTFNIKSLEIVPNFIEIPTISEYGIRSKGKLIFLFLGKIVKEKGIFDLIEAVKKISIDRPDQFELWVAGNGEVDKFLATVSAQNLNAYIKFKGWVSGNNKNQIIFQSDIYILPSYMEGMPVSILEAMSFGKPVIATNVGGIPELVQDGVSGILIKAGDVNAIYDAILAMIDNAEMVRSMGIQSREIVKTRYSSELVIEKLEKIYADLAGFK